MTSADGARSDFESIARRHLTADRRRVLASLQQDGPATPTEIALRWPEPKHRSGAPAHRLPAIVSQLAWKLENLGWIAPTDDRYAITATGRRVLAATSPNHHEGDP